MKAFYSHREKAGKGGIGVCERQGWIYIIVENNGDILQFVYLMIHIELQKCFDIFDFFDIDIE